MFLQENGVKITLSLSWDRWSKSGLPDVASNWIKPQVGSSERVEGWANLAEWLGYTCGRVGLTCVAAGLRPALVLLGPGCICNEWSSMLCLGCWLGFSCYDLGCIAGGLSYCDLGL